MVFTLPDLPYAQTALEPHVDALTMNIHHSKHHQTYVNNVNAALEKFPELKDLGLVDLNKAVGTSAIPTEVSVAVRNNGGGHWNHSFFWTVMGAPTDTNGAAGELKAAIDSSFGSIDEMKAKFNAAAAGRFGSGWAWLGVKPDGSLAITSTPNQVCASRRGQRGGVGLWGARHLWWAPGMRPARRAPHCTQCLLPSSGAPPARPPPTPRPAPPCPCARSPPTHPPKDNPLMGSAEDKMIPILGLDVWEVRAPTGQAPKRPAARRLAAGQFAAYWLAAHQLAAGLACSLGFGLQPGLRLAAGALACSRGFGLRPGLWLAAGVRLAAGSQLAAGAVRLAHASLDSSRAQAWLPACRLIPAPPPPQPTAPPHSTPTT
jgi:Fe-Mn family superoxide dismutase